MPGASPALGGSLPQGDFLMLHHFFKHDPTSKFIFIPLLSVCIMLALSGSLIAMDPQEHITEIGRAIDSGDVEIFTELVDIDAVLNNALDVFVKEASRPENAKHLPPMLALILPRLQVEGASPVKALLLGEAKNFVLSGIASGAFAGRKPDLSKNSGLLAPLFAQASMGRKEIRNIGKPSKIDTGWLIPFVIYDYDNENEYPVKAFLEYRGTDLKLTGVENMRQLIYQIGEESAASQD